MNELEQQLHSWAPRHPSASVKARIFANPGTETPLALGAAIAPGATLAVRLESPSFRLNWLAPGFAALLLVCLVFSQRNLPAAGSALAEDPMFAVALSNQSAAAWLHTGFTSSQNRVPSDTLEWTNGARPNPASGPVSIPGEPN